MRLQQLRQKAAETLGKMQAISEAAAKEKRSRTEDEKVLYDALNKEHVALGAEIKDEEELQARLRAAKTSVPDADQAAAAASAAAGGVSGDRLAVGQDRALDPKQPGFFGRQLQAVRKIAVHEANAQDMALVRMMAGPTGMSTDVPSDGGFLVNQERSSTIIQRAYDVGEILALLTPMPIGPDSNGITLPAIDETSRANGSRFGGIASGWLGQGNTTTAGKPKFRAMNLKLKKVAGFVYTTDELLADSVALDGWINRYLPLELMFRTEDAVINGDGSDQPAGVLNSGAAVSVTRSLTSHVVYDDVAGMWKRMWAPLRKRAVWLVDQSVEQELETLNIPIGTAGVLAPIYKPAGIAVGPDGTQGYSPATLYGRPILTTEYGANLGTVGDIMLVNFDEYTLIDKGGVNQAVSLHVAFLTDEAVYRFIYRVDGQSNWNAALTPKSGGSTLSPIVTLAT